MQLMKITNKLNKRFLYKYDSRVAISKIHISLLIKISFIESNLLTDFFMKFNSRRLESPIALITSHQISVKFFQINFFLCEFCKIDRVDF